MHKSVSICVAIVCVSFAACATGPAVTVDQDPAIEMSSYKTFGFFTPLATDHGGYESMMTAHLKQATREQFEKHGYRFDDVHPDLRVNFYLNIVDRQEVRTNAAPAPGFYGYRGGYYGAWRAYPYNVETVNYQAGTLSIDLIDAKRKALVWQGIARGKVREEARKDPAQAVNNAVGEMFENFPAATTDL